MAGPELEGITLFRSTGEGLTPFPANEFSRSRSQEPFNIMFDEMMAMGGEAIFAVCGSSVDIDTLPTLERMQRPSFRLEPDLRW